MDIQKRIESVKGKLMPEVLETQKLMKESKDYDESYHLAKMYCRQYKKLNDIDSAFYRLINLLDDNE